MTRPDQQKTRHFFNQTRLHETNYLLLNSLLPELHQLSGNFELKIDRHTVLRIEIVEHHKYTSELTLTILIPQMEAIIPELTLHVRVYHDAHVAEATHYQGHGHFLAQHPYPNPQGYHGDEKHQANRLLQECLKYCLKQLPHRPDKTPLPS